jgi:holo-[acyl-carrier protein] synthase
VERLVILGIGIDLVEVVRIEKAIARGERLVRRLFTANEIAYCRRHKEPARHFAARFAAKEAGMKAIGTGWSNGVSWQDFEVQLDPRGRPHLLIKGRAAEFANAMGATHSVISLAHDGGLATAVVALEGEAPADGEKWLTGRAAIATKAAQDIVTELIDETPGVSTAEAPQRAREVDEEFGE